MIDILDVHTHTLASGHAYNTMWEMAREAAEKGLQLLGITDHAPQMPGSSHEYHFSNLRVAPRELFGLVLLHGSELNILDDKGSVDLSREVLSEMDLTIASLHPPCYTPGTKKQNTQAYLRVMDNPYINIVGHPDDGRYEVDYTELVKAAKETHTLLEINNNSLNPRGFRKGARENDIQMLELCAEYEVPVIMGSDAHIATEIGNHARVVSIMEEIHFPEQLVVNRSVEELMKFVNYRKQERA
ncbi:MAG: phosphatase [Marvinbryantia sp.]